MKSNLYVIILILSLVFVASYSQDANASHFKVIKGKLTAPCHNMPFGGEEVGSFKMKIDEDKGIIEIMKIKMNRPPKDGSEYKVGLSIPITSIKQGIPVLEPSTKDTLDKYETEQQDGNIILKGIPLRFDIDIYILFVTQRSGQSDIGEPIVGSADLFRERLDATSTRFQYEDAVLVNSIDIDKREYKIDETIKVKPKLVNIGNEALTISHSTTFFLVKVYNSKGATVWSSSTITSLIPIEVKLEPEIPYYGKQKEGWYDIRVCMPSEYRIASYSWFDVIDPSRTLGQQVLQQGKVHSEPVVIKVGPETSMSNNQ